MKSTEFHSEKILSVEVAVESEGDVLLLWSMLQGELLCDLSIKTYIYSIDINIVNIRVEGGGHRIFYQIIRCYEIIFQLLK